MIIEFNIEYRTDWGEEIRISGSVPELGGGDINRCVPLSTHDGLHWSVSIDVSIAMGEELSYSYCVYKDGALFREEWSLLPHCLSIENSRNYKVVDCWKNIPGEQPFYSSAFTQCLFARPARKTAMESYEKMLILKVVYPALSKDYSLGICGNQEILGNWDFGKPLLLDDTSFPEWQLLLDASKLMFPLEYKFVLYNRKEKKVESWEQHPNRCLEGSCLPAGGTLVVSTQDVGFDVPRWKGAGVAIPVFSLKSEQSYGIGDFGDLKRMSDWVIKTGQKVLQILPINDTTMTHTWMDSYPYNCISIYALHPLYMDLTRLGEPEDKGKREYFREEQEKLNSYPVVDYERVSKVKWEYFRLMYAREWKSVSETDGFKSFFHENKSWLVPYAAFSYLRDLYGNSDFRLWPRYSEYNAEDIDLLCEAGTDRYDHIAIHYYIQYNLHCQLLEATEYARKQGVVLKGDIPIGINRNSVEAWVEPYYFNLNGQAGAPPDDFSVNGQNWGFPTYNWDIMAKDGYKWWLRRFQKMSAYFDAYRIDHILGFFRIWEIPLHSVHGLLGQFVPSLPVSREEIEGYGLKFDEKRFLNPCIQESFINQLFGPYAEVVKKDFICPAHRPGYYEVCAGFDTQRKVEAYFRDKTDAGSITVRDGLYTLISDVLFVRDHQESDKFHPRISAQHTFVYQSLDAESKRAFDRLYEQYFYHRHNEFWYRQAMNKLPHLVHSTTMLACGEDLGMIPESVSWLMDELQLLSLEIQRMPKDPSVEFGNLSDYPYHSVSTISTHDMSTFRGWWKEDPEKTQRYYNNVLGHYGIAPAEADGRICEEVVRMHLQSNSMFVILSLQDWLSMDDKWCNPDIEAERINEPANPKHYWRYRMHLSIEKLMKADSINEKIRYLIGQERGD